MVVAMTSPGSVKHKSISHKFSCRLLHMSWHPWAPWRALRSIWSEGSGCSVAMLACACHFCLLRAALRLVSHGACEKVTLALTHKKQRRFERLRGTARPPASQAPLPESLEILPSHRMQVPPCRLRASHCLSNVCSMHSVRILVLQVLSTYVV